MGRSVEFIGGSRERVSADDVRAAWNALDTGISDTYATGTALHESNFTLNEKDTEVSGYVTTGLFQVSDDEARAAGVDPSELATLDGNIRAFAFHAKKHLRAIESATGSSYGDLAPDVLAYLAIAHNRGIGNYQTEAERKASGKKAGCLGTIADYGVDWDGYKSRNPGDRINAYGDDCISGGSLYGRAKAEIAQVAEMDLGIDKGTGNIAAVAIIAGAALVIGLALLHALAPDLMRI